MSEGRSMQAEQVAPLKRRTFREQIADALLVTVPYTGTHVVDLSLKDIREIFSLRTELEVFAFRQVWDRRDDRFRAEMTRRHEALLDSIRAGDDETTILDELALHSWVYEYSDHQLLLNTWVGLRGKLQLYWAAHHRAHGRRGPHIDGHRAYVEVALGDDLEAAIAEVRDHMLRGATQTEAFLEGAPLSPSRKNA